MRRYAISLAVVFLLVPAGLQAGARVGGLTLGFQDVLRIAAEKNAEILAAKDHVDAALSRVTQARSYFFPDLSAGVSEERQTQNLETFGIPLASGAPTVVGPFNVFDARVRLTQTLFDVSMIRRFRAAEAGGDLSKAEYRKVREDILALAGTLFVQARRAQARVSYAKDNLRFAASRERILRTRLALGTASETEVKIAQAALSQARYVWRSSASDASASLLDLKTMLGFSPDQQLSLQDGFSPAGLPAKAVILRSVESHPEVAVLKAQERQGKAQEAAERAAYLPTVQGTADYGVNGRTADNSKETYLYGVRAHWDLFDFGRRSSRVREASARVHEIKTDLDRTLREKESKIYQARDAMKNAERSVRAAEDGWIAEKSAYEAAKNRFQNGSASRLDLIAAETLLARAADEREEAHALYRIAGINLDHTLGQMTNFLKNKDK